ncbi:hypothetical protein Drose_21160 [Dactylosporangium roseum]|uniref:Uncharacterized protein n=1 Tax=Dactylosporangium roseum TaxID=47989 RepID=A0ABY5YVL2_9ACTN|nr:DUF5995 family protein [Dactylosporangium roseum]UWZ33785.1 hypothetical protein Drose_21160 [Dactylosporangium roseum]
MDAAIAGIVRRMEAGLERLDAGDARRFFHQTYLRTTLAVAEEIDRGGFRDAEWLSRWDVVFADLYLDVLDADLSGTAAVPGPWRVAFGTARDRPELPPLRHVLLGLNAHINYDLPQSLVAVIDPAGFDDPAVRRAREADHTHVDTVLLARVGAEDALMRAVSRVGPLDRLMGPANRAATRRVLRESRAKVWRNATVLDQARRDGPREYVAVLRRLEDACTAKLVELTAPGPVMLRLARRGFGVTV